MRAASKVVFAALSALSLIGGNAQAAAVDDANAAVLAARDGKYEDAVQLFTNAINSDELNTRGRAQAYAYRGIAKATVGDYTGAQEDLNFAVVLDSDFNMDAYAFRGYFRMMRGEPRQGADDLAKSASLGLWGYSAIWLHLARLKAGIEDEGEHSLRANVDILTTQKNRDGSTEMSRWPAPVIRYLMGQATETQIRAAAKEGDPAKLKDRVCDVDFYIAELDLARGEAAKAKPKLQVAAKECPFASFERMGAAVELDRLK